jgi:hypothetical protein
VLSRTSTPTRAKPMWECAKCPHRKHADVCGTDCGCARRSKLAKPMPRQTVAIVRSSPMPRATKPVRHRNPERRPADKASLQRERVMERARGRCEMEKLSGFRRTGFGAFSEPIFERCNVGGKLVTAHVVRRWKIAAPINGAEPAVYSVDVAIAACDHCHVGYDSRQHRTDLRVPEEFRLSTFLTIRAAELARLEIALPCDPVNLSELLPAGGYTVETQYTPLGRFAPGFDESEKAS